MAPPPPIDTGNTVTQLLVAWRAGDRGVLDRLMPLVYQELHALAHRHMRGEREDHTLQTTALVHEAFLRLSGSDVKLQDRVHFFALAASTMRRVLVDHAKSKQRAKRGGGAVLLSIDAALDVSDAPSDDVISLDDALERLTQHDERKARVVELHYFAGLTYEEIATSLDVSVATVDRDLRFAKAWLYNDLSQGGAITP